MTEPTHPGALNTEPLRARSVQRYGPLLVWMIFISVFSTAHFSSVNTSRFLGPLLLWLFPNLSTSQMESLVWLIRKLGHLTEYAILAFFARRAFVSSTNKFIRRRWFESALLLVVVYSLLDEFHQSFVPSRTASIYDSLIDMAGGLTVLLVYKLRANDSTGNKGGLDAV